MSTSLDEFIDTIERRRRQLDDVLDAYRSFREKLDLLPDDLADEAKHSLGIEKETAYSLPRIPVFRSRSNPDMAGKASLQCAAIILRENDNKPTHYAEMAKEMIARGYRGRRAGTPHEIEQRTMQSLWAALSRSSEFTGTGKGFYKLADWSS